MSIMDANSVLIERRQMPASGALEYRRYSSTMLAIPMTASATKNSARTSKKNRRRPLGHLKGYQLAHQYACS